MESPKIPVADGPSSYVHSHAYTDMHVYDIAAGIPLNPLAPPSTPQPINPKRGQQVGFTLLRHGGGNVSSFHESRVVLPRTVTMTHVFWSCSILDRSESIDEWHQAGWSVDGPDGRGQRQAQSIGIMTQGADIQVRTTRDAGGLQPCPGPAWFSNAPQLCYLPVNDPADEFWDCREALRTTCGDRTLCDVTSVVDDGSDLNQLFEFDMASSVWTDLSTPLGGSPPVARNRHAMAATDCKLFVFGGTTSNAGGAETDDFYEYDIAARWLCLLLPLASCPCQHHALRSSRRLCAWF
eukprot:3937994-Rhodomonas_salina.1